MKKIHFPFAVLAALALFPVAIAQAQITVADASPRGNNANTLGVTATPRTSSNSNLTIQVSAQMRETDPTVMDVTYVVHTDPATTPTVNVRALAFQDGERGFGTVIRPETFIEGTDTNLGDEIAANTEHVLSWRVASDWQTDLANVAFEILVMKPGDALLPLHFVTVPAADGHAKLTASVNDFVVNAMYTSYVNLSNGWYSVDLISEGIYSALSGFKAPALLDALFWLYADHDADLKLFSGLLRSSREGFLVNHDFFLVLVSTDQSIFNYFRPAFRFVFRKMGYTLLEGDNMTWFVQETRLNRNPSNSVYPPSPWLSPDHYLIFLSAVKTDSE